MKSFENHFPLLKPPLGTRAENEEFNLFFIQMRLGKYPHLVRNNSQGLEYLSPLNALLHSNRCSKLGVQI